MTTATKATMLAAPLALLMLALALITFTSTRLFTGMSGAAGITLPANSLYLYIAIIVALSALSLLKIWNDSRIKIVMYLSFVLYLPAVLGFSRMDLLMAFGSVLNFSIFASSLPSAAIALTGIGLACGGLLLQSFSRMGKARQSFLGRGANQDEVDHALSRNLRLEVWLIAASVAVVLLITAGVSVAVPAVLWVLQSVGFIYVLAATGGVLILGLIIVAYTRVVS